MDQHVHEFYTPSDEAPKGHFHKTINLVEQANLSFEEVQKIFPEMPRGWYELAHLPTADRIEFTRQYWHSKLPYYSQKEVCIGQFFDSLGDIDIVLVQKEFEGPFGAHLVYSRKEDSGFFYGNIGATEKEFGALKQNFPAIIFPEDYLSFIQIHNGFSKGGDRGILTIEEVIADFNKFQCVIKEGDPLLLDNGQEINPATLIPFYESFDMPVYQCFWAEWYPEEEMGNVYFSCLTKTISDIQERPIGVENLAFPTFLEWLHFYLEKIG